MNFLKALSLVIGGIFILAWITTHFPPSDQESAKSQPVSHEEQLKRKERSRQEAIQSKEFARQQKNLKVSRQEQPACDAALAKKLFYSMINDTHVFRRIKTTSSIPKVTVEDVWYTLDIEDKKTIDNGVLCYLADGFTSKVPLVEYLDSRTGKTVAMSGPRGFSMK